MLCQFINPKMENHITLIFITQIGQVLLRGKRRQAFQRKRTPRIMKKIFAIAWKLLQTLLLII